MSLRYEPGFLEATQGQILSQSPTLNPTPPESRNSTTVTQRRAHTTSVFDKFVLDCSRFCAEGDVNPEPTTSTPKPSIRNAKP